MANFKWQKKAITTNNNHNNERKKPKNAGDRKYSVFTHSFE